MFLAPTEPEPWEFTVKLGLVKPVNTRLAELEDWTDRMVALAGAVMFTCMHIRPPQPVIMNISCLKSEVVHLHAAAIVQGMQHV